MIDLYYWPTPNGWKITILLEELAVPYRLVPVHIGKGEQFAPEFLRISPNNRIPAIVDKEPKNHSAPITIFESGAIMMYLAEKYGRFWPQTLPGKYEVAQWLFWQIGGLGPMGGQLYHFRDYAPEKSAYAIERYSNEINRLYGVMNGRLADRPYLAGDYSIADMACWCWVRLYRQQGQQIEEFPHLKRWLEELASRPAVNRGFRVGAELRGGKPTMTEEAKKFLLGQRARPA